MDSCHTAPLSSLLKVDPDLVQMVSDLKTGEASNLEDCLSWVSCEALLKVGKYDLRESGYGISEFLVEGHGVIQELLSFLAEDSHASFNISQEKRTGTGSVQ